MLSRSSLIGLPKTSLGASFVLCLVILVGCRDSGIATVEGTVTLDGNPIQSGAINFEPLDGHGATAGATIEDGKYVAEMPVGEKKVRITGFKIVGQVAAYKNMPDSPMRDVVQDLVPSQFNTQSKLSLDVVSPKTDGSFDLTSSKQK